jgi:hypothetical protein
MADAMRDAQRNRKCCAACRFWNTRMEGEFKGACHRFPPQVVQGRGDRPPNAHPKWAPRPEHYFPMTMHDQWCGEFQEGE